MSNVYMNKKEIDITLDCLEYCMMNIQNGGFDMVQELPIDKQAEFEVILHKLRMKLCKKLISNIQKSEEKKKLKIEN